MRRIALISLLLILPLLVGCVSQMSAARVQDVQDRTYVVNKALDVAFANAARDSDSYRGSRQLNQLQRLSHQLNAIEQVVGRASKSWDIGRVNTASRDLEQIERALGLVAAE